MTAQQLCIKNVHILLFSPLYIFFQGLNDCASIFCITPSASSYSTNQHLKNS